jgi:hypothetical protein
MNIYNKDNTININVGNKLFTIHQNKINKNEKLKDLIENYDFIDMDPNIFSYIIELIDKELEQTNHHKKYNNTLVQFKLLNKELYIKPFITLNDVFNYDADDMYTIITINCKGHVFKTFKCTIMKSSYLIKKLAASENNIIYLDIQYKSFNYILNLLRDNETCFFPKEYINDLEQFQLNYKIYNNTVETNIYQNNQTNISAGLIHMILNDNKIYDQQLKKILNKYRAKPNIITNNDQLYSYSSSNQYFNIKPINDIDFEKTIIFNFDSKNYGDIIDDLILVIYLPQLKKGKWIHNSIIKQVELFFNNKIISKIPGQYIDIYNKLYNTNYDKLSCSNKIYIPIKFNQKIPVIKESIKVSLHVEINKLQNCIINNNLQHNLVDCTLISNFINLSTERNLLINNKDLYIYNTINHINTPINQTDNNDFNITKISLNDNIDYIKDLVITIATQDHLYDPILIDAKLIINDYVFFNLDSIMLNKYIPLKYLNSIPATDGIYYYSFSNNPMINKLFGGLCVNSNKQYKINLIIKTNKKKGIINIFSNNYSLANL